MGPGIAGFGFVVDRMALAWLGRCSDSHGLGFARSSHMVDRQRFCGLGFARSSREMLWPWLCQVLGLGHHSREDLHDVTALALPG